MMKNATHYSFLFTLLIGLFSATTGDAQNVVYGETAEAMLAEKIDAGYHLSHLEEEIFRLAEAVNRFDLYPAEALNAWDPAAVADPERRQVVLLPITLDSVNFAGQYPDVFEQAAAHGFDKVMGVTVRELTAIPIRDNRYRNQEVYSGFEGRVIYRIAFFEPADGVLAYQVLIGENNVGNSTWAKAGAGATRLLGRLTGNSDLVQSAELANTTLNEFQAPDKKGALENAVRQSGKDLRTYIEENFILELPVISCRESDAYKYQLTIRGGERFGLEKEQKVDIMDPNTGQDNLVARVVIKAVEADHAVAKLSKKEFKAVQAALQNGSHLVAVVGKDKSTLLGEVKGVVPFGKKKKGN